MKTRFFHRHFKPSAPAIMRHFRNAHFPSDWDTLHLDDLVEASSPICYGILMPGNHVPDGVPVIKVKDYVNGRLYLQKLLRTSPLIDSQYERSRIKTGDIILSIRGGTGDIAIVPQELDGANITQDTARVRIKTDVDRDYIAHSLTSAFVQTQVALDTIGQAVTGINISSVRQLVIPIPPLPEQRKIADILTTWDEALEKLDALIEAQERRKQALMQQLLSGKKRLKGFDRSKGKVSIDRFGSYPADWRKVALGAITEELSNRNPEFQDLPVLSCTKHEGLVLSEGYFGRRVYASDTSNYRMVKRGEFAYATNHIEEGSIGYQNICDAGLVSPIYTVFKTVGDVDDNYLFRVLKSPLLVHLYRTNTSASVDRRGSLRYDEFSRIHIWLPSKDEQKAIAAILDTADQQLTLLRNQRTALDQQKRGLMQLLLTGKLRVNL